MFASFSGEDWVSFVFMGIVILVIGIVTACSFFSIKNAGKAPEKEEKEKMTLDEGLTFLEVDYHSDVECMNGRVLRNIALQLGVDLSKEME